MSQIPTPQMTIRSARAGVHGARELPSVLAIAPQLPGRLGHGLRGRVLAAQSLTPRYSCSPHGQPSGQTGWAGGTGNGRALETTGSTWARPLGRALVAFNRSRPLPHRGRNPRRTEALEEVHPELRETRDRRRETRLRPPSQLREEIWTRGPSMGDTDNGVLEVPVPSLGAERSDDERTPKAS